MARRNIRINVEFTLQSTRVIKRVLKSTLSDNLNKKCIVYTNTASCLDQLKIDVEHWLDSSDGIKGDALIIHGDMKAEVKFVSAQMFTKTTENAEELVNTNSFYPRILMATAGSIGAGLDSGDVYCVVKVGFSTSILEMVQEMGRCGRGRQNGNSLITDDFHLLLSCRDFVYLNQRLYKPQQSLPNTVKAILTVDEEI